MDHVFVYTGPDLNLIRKPTTLPSCSPRRHRFSYQYRVLMDKFVLHNLGSRRTLDQPNFNDLQEWAMDEAFKMVDLSNAYQLEIWYDRRTQRMFLQFTLAD